MKKKLLIVVSSAKFFLSHRLPLAKAAQAAGYEVHIATSSSTLNGEITANELLHHCISIDRGGLNPFRDIISIFSLYRLYRHIQPDVVHLVAIKPILYGGIAARLAGVPSVVNTISGLGYIFISDANKIKILRSIVLCGYRIVFRHFNMCAIFQNEDDRSFFINKKILDENKTVLIHGSGVDMQQYVASQETNEFAPIVILPSRLLWDKGIAEFVAAARLLKKQNVAARFVLAGCFDDENPAVVPKQKLKAWADEGVIEWWGERNDMPNVFRQCNIVCLPSYREGLPRVLVEAAASGRAIVTTNAPGCRDVVRNGQNGLLVPIKNTERLVEALLKLIDKPQLRKNMGQKGRKIVEHDYSLDTVLKQTLAVYENLLLNHSQGCVQPQDFND